MNYEVVVGNIGCVYYGEKLASANSAFKEYCKQSKESFGRASGESVVMMKDGEIIKEYIPNIPTAS